MHNTSDAIMMQSLSEIVLFQQYSILLKTEVSEKRL